jgi:aspartokinase-like uncharacterized kinase
MVQRVSRQKAHELDFTIVKLGGSLLAGGRLAELLETLTGATRPVAIVPGGGPFADAVRAAQHAHGFSDAAAHRMAVLAMSQLAWLMMELQPRLASAVRLADFRKLWMRGQIPVWLPSRLVNHDRMVPQDWTITSDGLAARLAERLHARQVILVKSLRVPATALLSDLVSANVVDPSFPGIVERAGLGWHVMGPDRFRDLARQVGASHSVRQRQQ